MDRYTGWVSVSEPLMDNSDAWSLLKRLCEWFGTFGVPKEIPTDGGQPLTSNLLHSFLPTCGARQQLVSVYYVHVTGRPNLA